MICFNCQTTVFLKRFKPSAAGSARSSHPLIRRTIRLKNMVDVLQGVAGRTSDTIYDLFFSEKKVVFAILLRPSDLARMYKPDLLSVFVGRPLISEEIKTRSKKLIEKRRLSLKNKNVDEILAMDQANTQLTFEEIESVKIRNSFLSTYLEFRVGKQGKRKIVLSLKRSQVAEAERILSKVFPSGALLLHRRHGSAINRSWTSAR